MKTVLVLGACGNIGPHVTPLLDDAYDLRLADVQPHPDGQPVDTVDVASGDDVMAACQGVDAIINFTVVRDDPVLSFDVSTRGVYNIMEAARQCGISTVIHTGPQSDRQWFDHDFDLDVMPVMPGTGYYMITKYLGMEISRIYARAYGIKTIWFLFNGLGPKPTEPLAENDYPPMTVVWDDLAHGCRLALEAGEIPDDYQYFNLLSYLDHGKYRIDSARRILGFEPLERLEAYFRRPLRTRPLKTR